MHRTGILRCVTSLSSRSGVAASPARICVAPRITRGRPLHTSPVHASNAFEDQTTPTASSDAWQSKDKESADSEQEGSAGEAVSEHAVLSTFDLFSIGIGPSSSVSR